MGKPDPTDTEKLLGKTDFPKLIEWISGEISRLKEQLDPIDKEKAPLTEELKQQRQHLDEVKKPASPDSEVIRTLEAKIRDLEEQIDQIDQEADPIRTELNARMQELAHAKADPPTHPGDGWIFEGIHESGRAINQAFGELEKKYGRGKVRMRSSAYNLSGNVILKGMGTIFIFKEV